MHAPLLDHLEALAHWRERVSGALVELRGWLLEHHLLGAAETEALQAVLGRLAARRLHVAVVGEFSRGKSELINALLFADGPGRALPVGGGRTTMCPVELAWDASQPAAVRLLPLSSRLRGRSVGAERAEASGWREVRYDPADPADVRRAFDEIAGAQRLPADEAQALGLGLDGLAAQASDGVLAPPTPRAADGSVEVPMWRHATINHPHPLLQSGLVLHDTPGVNAFGTEPELTEELLPTVHAVLFLLAADAGVTRSDAQFWQQHLRRRAQDHLIVLNKADALLDGDAAAAPPQARAEALTAAAQASVAAAAQALGVARERVFAVSARTALASRRSGDAAGWEASGVPALATALADRLLPRHWDILAVDVQETLEACRASVLEQLATQRRHRAEALSDLRTLQETTRARLELLDGRLAQQALALDQTALRLEALRERLMRQGQAVLALWAPEAIAAQFLAWPPEPDGLGAALKLPRAWEQIAASLQRRMREGIEQANALATATDKAVAAMNREEGCALHVAALPALEAQDAELERITQQVTAQCGLMAGVFKRSGQRSGSALKAAALARVQDLFQRQRDGWERWLRGQEDPLHEQVQSQRTALQQRGTALDRLRSALQALNDRIQVLEQAEADSRHTEQALERRIALTDRLTQQRSARRAEPTDAVAA